MARRFAACVVAALAAAENHDDEARGCAHGGDEHGGGEHGDGHGGQALEPSVVMFATLACIVAVISGLLVVFEKGVQRAREGVPSAFLPVINGALGEIATLGFVGLVVQFLEAYFEPSIALASEAAFGGHHVLIFAFEWFHIKFFETAILFFAFCGVLLLITITGVEKLAVAIADADVDRDGTTTFKEFVEVFGEDRLVKEASFGERLRTLSFGVSPADLFLCTARFAAAFNLDAERWHRGSVLYFCKASSEALQELVEVTPMVWSSIIPPLAYVEMLRIVVGTPMDDPNGSTAGMFFSDTVLTCFVCFFAMLGTAWGWFNYAFLWRVKSMCRPRVTVCTQTDLLTYREPLMYEEGAIEAHQKAHPGMLRVIDALAKFTGSEGATKQPHHRLFGAAGEKGPELMALSFKLHTWTLIMNVLLGTLVVIVPDVTHLVREGPGSPVVLIELISIALMNGWFVFWLCFLQPATFQLFITVTSIEGFVDREALDEAMENPREELFGRRSSAGKQETIMQDGGAPSSLHERRPIRGPIMSSVACL